MVPVDHAGQLLGYGRPGPGAGLDHALQPFGQALVEREAAAGAAIASGQLARARIPGRRPGPPRLPWLLPHASGPVPHHGTAQDLVLEALSALAQVPGRSRTAGNAVDSTSQLLPGPSSGSVDMVLQPLPSGRTALEYPPVDQIGDSIAGPLLDPVAQLIVYQLDSGRLRGGRSNSSA